MCHGDLHTWRSHGRLPMESAVEVQDGHLFRVFAMRATPLNESIGLCRGDELAIGPCDAASQRPPVILTTRGKSQSICRNRN